MIEDEAKRRNLSPSGLMAAIVETWAQARATAVLSRRLTVCRIDGCERAVTARGLCGAHYQQARAGKQLKPAWEKMRDTVKMGSLRLAPDAMKRLRTAAGDGGLTVSEVVRRALAEALEDIPKLVATSAQTRVRSTAKSIRSIRTAPAFTRQKLHAAHRLHEDVQENHAGRRRAARGTRRSRGARPGAP